MSDAASVVALLLRGCFALAMAVLLEGASNATLALANGAPHPSPLQPWRDLRRLARTQALLPEDASALLRLAPQAIAAATLAAAMLAPSFTAAKPGDLLAVAGLLGLAGLAHVLALADGGAALGGAVAARGLVAGALAWPAVIALVLFGELAGGGETAGTFLAACAGVALAYASYGDRAREADGRVWSGMDLAFIRASSGLRTVTVLTALTGFFPVGQGSLADPSSWPFGVVAWVAKLVFLGVAFAFARALLPSGTRLALGMATILGALALMVLLARQVPA